MSPVPIITCRPMSEVLADPFGPDSRFGIFTHYSSVVNFCDVSPPDGMYTDVAAR